MTDSTTSEGWLRKSSFIEDGEDPIQATIQIEVAVARLHATHYLSNEVREYIVKHPIKYYGGSQPQHFSCCVQLFFCCWDMELLGMCGSPTYLGTHSQSFCILC